MKTYQNYINGEWVDSKSGQYTDVINPTSEEVIAQVPTSNAEDVDNAVAAAKAAFPSWNGLAVDERKAYLEKVLEGLKAHKEELVDIVVEEMGASKAFSRDNQVRKSIGELEGSLKALDRFNFEERYDTATVIKEGSGVVACITPWNYPLNQIQRKLTPALLTGNTIVVKPASDTPPHSH
ncbi:aldehyde dehydrogenase family protein [Aerococcus sanguinicola]|uniref:aldehyde dehydrogenase family protein n=1 Tax=Aerococcus sanguinicola TaxID=119206 RepID=UPI0026A400F4|nr:aldehyde dehydrogenase family protein [Aerococcus sanguinicola]